MEKEGVFSQEGDSQSFLDAFKTSLKEEYEKKFQERAKEYDSRLADALAEKRLEVEKKVARMRHKQERALEEQKERSCQKLLGELKEEIHSMGDHFVDRVRQGLLDAVAALQEEGLFHEREKAFFYEALQPFDGSPVILYCTSSFPEDLKTMPQIVERNVLEHEEFPGGCLLVDAATQKTVVDNRLSTRWNKVRKELGKEIGTVMEALFSEIPREARELRLR